MANMTILLDGGTQMTSIMKTLSAINAGSSKTLDDVASDGSILDCTTFNTIVFEPLISKVLLLYMRFLIIDEPEREEKGAKKSLRRVDDDSSKEIDPSKAIVIKRRALF